MVTHSSVPTTCTATLITGWDFPNFTSKDPKMVVNSKLNAIKDIISKGFKKDFSIIHVFITGQQDRAGNLSDFLTKCGFTMAYHGSKKLDDSQRHKETGDLYLWATDPSTFEASLLSYEKELVAEKDIIDPPKKPDPERLKFEDILLSKLRKSGIVFDNACVHNSIVSILAIPEDKAHKHILVKYGINLRKFKGPNGTLLGDSWVNITVHKLKDYQKQWKEELL